MEIVTGYILHVIHVAGTRMKRAGIDSFSRGDLLDVMMNSQNPLEFIPQNESADERSGGQVLSWITYWCKYRTGAAWVGRALKKLSPNNWFKLHTQDRPILWTPPPAEMETVVCPWVIRGSSPALEVQDHLEARFKHPELHGCGKFNDLEGPVHGVKYPKEECSRALLFKFLEEQKIFAPCHAVWCG